MYGSTSKSSSQAFSAILTFRRGLYRPTATENLSEAMGVVHTKHTLLHLCAIQRLPSTDTVIAVFKRFTARQGIWTTLRSNCGIILKGAESEMKKLFIASGSSHLSVS